MYQGVIKNLYLNYLIYSTTKTTATGLSAILDGNVSHDQITRFLSTFNTNSKALWLEAKPLVKKHQTEDAALIIDDTIIMKPYTDPNAIVCRHFDHCSGQYVNGINLVSMCYHSNGMAEDTDSSRLENLRIALDYRIVSKTKEIEDKKTKVKKLVSEKTKNEMVLEMIQQACVNKVLFRYVLGDSWFSSKENMITIHERKKYFVFAFKSNRLIADFDPSHQSLEYKNVDSFDLTENVPKQVWMKDIPFPVLVLKQVFTNKDASIGIRYLVTDDLTLNNSKISRLFKKRWGIEEYHKGLKQNNHIADSPTQTVQTQKAHILLSILSYLKLEKIKLAKKLNHFAVEAQLKLAGMKASQNELVKLCKECRA